MKIASIAMVVTVLGFVPAVGAQAPQPAETKPAKPLSIEDVLKRPAIAEPLLSPNGRYFAVLSPINDRLNLAIIDLESRKGVAITNFRDFDVREVAWVGNERLVYSLGQFNGSQRRGITGGRWVFHGFARWQGESAAVADYSRFATQ